MQHSISFPRGGTVRAALTTMILAFASASAQAALVTFTVAIDSGPLNGSTYSGSLAYDDPVAGFVESVDLTAFVFDFGGQSITLSSADSTPTARFVGGSFVGIDYADFDASPTAQFTAGFLDISESFFAYDSASTAGNSGFGSVVFSVVEASVPEPSGIALAVTCLAMLGAVRRRSSR